MRLRSIFGRKTKEEEQEAQPAVEIVDCPHVVLSPRWDNVEDIGHEDRAVGYRCVGCNQEFTAEEAEQVKQAAKEILASEAATFEEIEKET